MRFFFFLGLVVGLHDILNAIVMRISSVKLFLFRSSLTSYAIHTQNCNSIACDIERDIA